MSQPTRQGSARGFTLIELGVALAVAAVLAAAVLPDMVESSRNVQAQRTALDISYIHDAARWYRSQTNAYASAAGTGQDTWPGQSSSGAAGTCPPVDSSTAFDNLKQNGFLIQGLQRNPWGKDYVASGVMDPANPKGCMFMVSTEVPNSVALTFTGMLPLSWCNDVSKCGPPATTPGYSKCCSAAVRPGMLLMDTCPAPSVVRFNADGTVTCGT